jgi:subtilase family serine protease
MNRSICRSVTLAAAVASAFLTACSPETQAEFANRTSDTTPYLVAGMSASDSGNTTGGVETGPTFHRLPITLDAPNPDQGDTPFTVDVDKSLAGIKTAGLTDAGLATALKDEVQPMATKRKAVVYNPQQIRAAYGLPAVPANITGLNAESRAALGAGQTIYIVDAYHNPNALTDLNIFSNKFGLPTCTEVTLPVTAKTLPALKDTDNCLFSFIYPIGAGRMGNKPPAYNQTWSQEIALDVQWAHAIAPLARIVLIEVPTAALNAMDAGVLLANALGPGVVSMSYGTLDNPVLERQSEYVFAGKSMTYIAAAGDSGMQANWPAMSPSVIAVGGTTLNSYTVSGATVSRNETVWAGSGGGYSVSSARPVWQSMIRTPNPALTPAKASTPNVLARVGNDVTYNADAWTGFYVAITRPTSKATQWYSFGGTSAGAPQWAGIVAVANAKRALKKLPPLGKFSPRLYREFGPGLGAFGGSFMDVTTGANGKCAWCSAAPGFDSPSGWGSPNGKLIESLSMN